MTWLTRKNIYSSKMEKLLRNYYCKNTKTTSNWINRFKFVGSPIAIIWRCLVRFDNLIRICQCDLIGFPIVHLWLKDVQGKASAIYNLGNKRLLKEKNYGNLNTWQELASILCGRTCLWTGERRLVTINSEKDLPELPRRLVSWG